MLLTTIFVPLAPEFVLPRLFDLSDNRRDDCADSDPPPFLLRVFYEFSDDQRGERREQVRVAAAETVLFLVVGFGRLLHPSILRQMQGRAK